MMSASIFRYLILLCLVLVCTAQDDCPARCSCKRSTQSDAPDWIKVRCGDEGGGGKIKTLDELNLAEIVASEIVQLNLSNNYLTEFSPKVQFAVLQKLDLSRNQLSALESGQFKEMPNLKKLDLSKNSIKHIDGRAFIGLEFLDRLKLNLNQISSISKASLKPLTSLKQLDISSNPLLCNCDLLWILEWSIQNSLKLISNPRCHTPDTFNGIPLKKIKLGIDIHCKQPPPPSPPPPQIHPQLPLHLHPAENQVVFEGDSLKLHCQAPATTKKFADSTEALLPHLQWTWLDSNPLHHFDDVLIESSFSPEFERIESSLTIPQLTRNHTGIWNCSLIARQQGANQSQGITVIVISEETQYCPIEITTNNRGTYTWPRTVVNFTVTVTCEKLILNREVGEQKASYFCSPEGAWENLNTTACAYTSETTRILEQFSKVNLSLTKANILESARHFRNHTSDVRIFKDAMDLVFVTRTIENYLLYLELERDLGAILMDVINNLIDLPAKFVQQADLIDDSCTKITKAVEIIAGYGTPFTLHKSNVATEQIPIQEETFNDMICMWFRSSRNTSDKLFSCVDKSRISMLGNNMESSVQVPASIFQQLHGVDGYKKDKMWYVIVTMYKNGRFFPVAEDAWGVREVTSPVVGVKLVNSTQTDLTEPIYVMMKTPPPFSTTITTTTNTPPTPVWWDPTANNGTGNWSTHGCQLKDLLHDSYLVFSCSHLSYYGLLQNTTPSSSSDSGGATYPPHRPPREFRFSHPAIYVGSFTLITSLIVAIMTYLLCYNAIQMPRKAKHALINVWVAIAILCFLFVFGIYQTENRRICQAVGLILHYLTLCSLLWMCVGVNYMYKRLIKNDSMDLQDDELPSEQPVQKPILGLYLVGWGVALIVCGISGAVNMKEYASHAHCFLNSGPSLSAVFIPVVILLVLLCGFFLVIRCAIYSVDTNGHLSEGTQATENVDLDLLEPNFPDSHSVRTNSTKTDASSSEIEDPEHAPAAQLKAYIVFLVIYILTWSSCALTTLQPFTTTFEEDIFSTAYAVCATTLGAFTLFFYCVARNDVRTQWTVLLRMFKRTRNVSDASSPQIHHQNHQAIINNPIQELQITSRSSSRSSTQTKTNSHASKVAAAAAVDLNGVGMGAGFSDGAKINNVNLVVLHRQQYRNTHVVVPNLIENPTSTAEMFYNPHQSTVARKFFRKQKRHLLKRNNLPPRDVNSDTASSCHRKHTMDRAIFGTNSKVNNTNIHVERVRKNKHKNPNILSDSCDEVDELKIPVEKLVLNAERLRRRAKKKQNHLESKESLPHMRSVSQQCTLEYSSETISDSILDKASPEQTVSAHAQQNKEQQQSTRIFANPTHDLEFPITSSVSASEIDELYQQIRGGGGGRGQRKGGVASPFHSDSEVNVVGGWKRRGSVSDKVETRV